MIPVINFANVKLDFQIFKKEDYPEYYSWFHDSDLNKQLGPLKKENEEWLQYVLDEQAGLTEYRGRTYSVFLKKKLVSVIGIIFPDEENLAYVITSIAVKPQLRNKGIGRKVLKDIIQLHPLKGKQYWIAHVDSKI